MTRREQAIEAAARARYEQAMDAGSYGGVRGPAWEHLSELREGWRRDLGPIVDAVLAVPCDCADRLDAEAERHGGGNFRQAESLLEAARFLRGES